MSDFHSLRPPPQGFSEQAENSGQTRTRRRRPPDAPPPSATYEQTEPQEWWSTPQPQHVSTPARSLEEPWQQWERTPMRHSQEWSPAPVYTAPQSGPSQPVRNQPLPLNAERNPRSQAGPNERRSEPSNRRPGPTERRPGPRGRKPKWKARLLPLAMITLTVAVLCLGSVVFVMYRDVNRHANTFYDGVYVAGIHLGGMTQEQAYQKILELEQQQLSQWGATLRNEYTQQTMTAEEIDLRLDLTSLLNDAWNQGRYGNMLERWRQISALRDTPYQKNGDGIYYNEAKLDAILLELQSSFERQASSASVSFSAEGQGGYQYQQEQVGQWLDIEPIREQIVESIQTLTSVNILLKPETIAPDVTLASLKAENSQIVSVFTKIRENRGDEGRTQNVRLACGKLDGYVLEPGKKLSFNGVVGKRTERNGFQEAREIAYGEYTVGIGGGVCQVSTTLYQAALRSGLKIETRSVHAIPSNYAEKGQDATVSDSGKDLVIRNTGSTPVYIKARVEEDKKEKRCVVEIYGKPLPDGVRYTLESKQVEVLEPDPPVKYIRDKKQEYVTYVDQEREVVKARVGYTVDTFLVTKRSDGMEVSRTKITTDTYPPKPAEVYQGVLQREETW